MCPPFLSICQEGFDDICLLNASKEAILCASAGADAAKHPSLRRREFLHLNVFPTLQLDCSILSVRQDYLLVGGQKIRCRGG
mmetsp:Transcript_12465/g.29730  ORF Transcript_12465/g.29730 Transcript_12465/m.29730 type:complete len:82 (-) Transcript_12465:1750-1995(-)